MSGDDDNYDDDDSRPRSDDSEGQDFDYDEGESLDQGSHSLGNASKEDEMEDESVQSAESQNQYDILPEEALNLKPNQERITSPFLTKYEKARIIGVRAVQISKNSPIYINIDHNTFDPLLIAERQLNERKIPFVIRRYLPDGSFEDWKISELKSFD